MALTLADFRVLIVPGLHDSGPEHWQTRWQQLHPAFIRVEQEQWDAPRLDIWSARLQHALAQSAQPTLLVAHSFGCLTTVHAARRSRAHLEGALLVAPADPDKFGVADQVGVALNAPSIVVGSTDDPWMSASRARYWAGQWGSRFINAGALGHINADSGLGDWEEGQDLLAELVKNIADTGIFL
ncbi:alpha/beta hydrolase [Herbaspirillum sp. RTI4]|uniref:RBBP9/YdeN family alpha/beta hydrolase n=1 Tax=Herbaspirillum sp. RTI4 TaxID=3048640 RepID=UPI002AB53729|nr:alpha/beta hydrolase [Herbaspirillum sp. RTI4]MDY7579689.1 alpha/beta hydrolase [Herbaspirillum sp. RTI4]MEA9983016.1 alpha/beta hydrolase [Herbaspirillum sp. RTI4]